MIKILNYLSAHKFINILIGFIVYLLLTLPHEFVGVTIAGIFKGVPRYQYDLTILTIGVIILFGFIVYLFRQRKRLSNYTIPDGYFLACLLLMIVSLHLLIIVNIEIIHFIQYAILAILLFPLFKRFFSTLLFITLLGAIDEAYQYYYLSPQRTNYYDFNDVILDLLGGAMGLIFLRYHKGISEFLHISLNHGKYWFRYASALTFFTLIFWQKEIVQSLFSSLGLDLDWANYGAVLIRKPTTGFWTEIPPKITYHVVQPIEGCILITLLLFGFSFIYRQAE